MFLYGMFYIFKDVFTILHNQYFAKVLTIVFCVLSSDVKSATMVISYVNCEMGQIVT